MKSSQSAVVLFRWRPLPNKTRDRCNIDPDSCTITTKYGNMGNMDTRYLAFSVDSSMLKSGNSHVTNIRRNVDQLISSKCQGFIH